MKIIAQVLVAAVCVLFGFALGRMYPPDKGPSPRPTGPGTTRTSGTTTTRPGALPLPKGSDSPGTTKVSVSPTTGPEAPDHEHESG